MHYKVTVLRRVPVPSETVTRIVAGIAACRQRVRPDRSYDRHSRKPRGKWQSCKPAKATSHT